MKSWNSLATALACSLLLHIFIVIAITLNPSQFHAPEIERHEVFQIELPNRIHNPAAKKRHSNTIAKTSQPSQQAPLENPVSHKSLGNLLKLEAQNSDWRNDILTNGSRIGKFETGIGASNKVDKPNQAWGEGAGEFQRIEDYVLMKRIFDTVDSILFYPSILANESISGIVNSRIAIDSEGNCDFNRTEILGTEPHLRVFVLAVLKKTCSNNFKAYLKDRSYTQVDISFHFSITESSQSDLPQRGQFIVGNTLMMYRNQRRSILEWNFGPFKGIFPFAMVSLNFDWLQKNWEKYVNGRDPLDVYKQ